MRSLLFTAVLLTAAAAGPPLAAGPWLAPPPERGQPRVGPPPEPMPTVPGPERGSPQFTPRCSPFGGSACTSPFDGMPILNYTPPPRPLASRSGYCPPALQPPPRPWALIVPVTGPAARAAAPAPGALFGRAAAMGQRRERR